MKKKPKPKNPTLPHKEDSSKLFLGFVFALILVLGAYVVYAVSRI